MEDRLSPRNDDPLGRAVLALKLFEKWPDYRPFEQTRRFDMAKFVVGVGTEGDTRRKLRFASHVHVRTCLEGAGAGGG